MAGACSEAPAPGRPPEEVVDVSSDEDDVIPLDRPWGPRVCPGAPPLRFRDYRRGRELGSGGSSRVFVCSRDSCASRFAAKITDLRRLRLSANAERERLLLLREVEIFKALPQHPNIVQMFDAFQEGNWFFMILELVGEGDLFAVLTARRPPRLREPEARHVLVQLVSAVGFLHGRGVVHRDLKLENVLVASEHRLREQGQRRTVLYEVKITDFGLSKVVGGSQSGAHSVVGTRPYMAPEVEDRESSSYDFSSDVWCLGVLLYVLLAGQFPFDVTPTAQSQVDHIVDRLRGGDSAKPLLSGMLRLLPAGRLSLGAIAAAEWLAGDGGGGAGAAGASPEPQPKRPRPSSLSSATTTAAEAQGKAGTDHELPT